MAKKKSEVNLSTPRSKGPDSPPTKTQTNGLDVHPEPRSSATTSKARLRAAERVKKITRREFVTGAGAVIAFGAVSSLAACAPTATKTAGQPILEAVSGSAQIVHDPNICAGCGVCGLMCAFYHEKEYGYSLARNELVRDPFNASYSFHVCQQCKSPNCYSACPKKDMALRVDPKTGVKYVKIAECVGCGICSNACPFTPHRVNVHPVKKVAFKCDLCRGRKDGPICVEYCTMHALQKVSGKERG